MKKTPTKTVSAAAFAGSTDERKVMVDAKEALTLTITQKHIDRAKCSDPGECVIAQALESHCAGLSDGFQVGSNITKIIVGKKIVRYRTPSKLANALRTFDVTGDWHLPPGQYTLLPFVRPANRWHKARRHGGKQDVFRDRISAPTRRTLSCATLRAA